MNLEETLLRRDLLFSPQHLSDNSRAAQDEKKEGQRWREYRRFDHRRGKKMTEMEGVPDIYSMNLLMSCCVL